MTGLRYYGSAAILGVATVLVMAGQFLPAWIFAATLAVSFILVLPRRPWLVAAFCGGAVLAAVTWSVTWSMAWGGGK